MKQPTILQQKQRELAWLIFVVCGAVGSMKNACANSTFLSDEVRKKLDTTISSLDQLEGELRSSIDNLKEPL